MYVNKINEIISQIIDDFYVKKITKENPITDFIASGKKNFVESRDKINDFIKSYVDSINIVPIQKLINNKENLQRIINIIKRYIAYYCFLLIAYGYTGTIKEYRNYLIQYSKLQEMSTYTIKNFYDTENNYKIIQFFKIIKESMKILLMTPLQQKTLNMADYKETVTFLNDLGREYIDSYILNLVTNKKGEQTVEINVHNLIKTIVFDKIYKDQEQIMVVKILSDIEATENEYMWIEIVVSADELSDLGFFQSIFAGEPNADTLAYDMYELANLSEIPVSVLSHEKKNNLLFSTRGVSPIVDDFLRYHRDIERLDVDSDKTFDIPSFSKQSGNRNERNIQLALMRQHKNKKENTKVQLIINKIEMISELYSDTIRNNPETERDIKKLFYAPLAHRKAVSYNYLDEVYVFRKMQLQGRKVTEGNEYYLELEFILANAYFNFKDFQKYGVTVTLDVDRPIQMLRYSDIEYISQFPQSVLDVRTGGSQHIINATGMIIGPIIGGPVQCMQKIDLVDIRSIKIPSTEGAAASLVPSSDNDDKAVTPITSANGYETFIKLMDRCLIKTIELKTKPIITIYNNYTSVLQTNPELLTKVIYWVYDVEKDTYSTETYENIKMYNPQDNIKFMNAKIYDVLMDKVRKQMIWLIKKNLDVLSLTDVETIIELFKRKYNLILSPFDHMKIIVEAYLFVKPRDAPRLSIITDADRFELPTAKLIEREESYLIQIDMRNPTHISEYKTIESHLTKDKATDYVVVSADKSMTTTTAINAYCRHETEWKKISKMKGGDISAYNTTLSQFISKYAVQTTESEYICRLCSQFLPIKSYVQDGKFDNTTQKFVTNYVPTYIPLGEISLYAKYNLTINYVDIIIKKISLFTGSTVLSGDAPTIKQKRKIVIKNVIDIFTLHNVSYTRMIKENPKAENMWTDFFAKNFGVDKNITQVFYFELSDSIYETAGLSPEEIEINKLKKNSLILYIVWLFILELNPSQILTMTTDRIANIYSMEKYGEKIFQGLFLKKNINSQERVPITHYPVLCYLLFVIPYFLIKYGSWYSTIKTNVKGFNVFILKQITHSLVELFNGFSLAAGKNSDTSPNPLFAAENSNGSIDQREFSRSNRDNGIDQREFSRSNRDNGIDQREFSRSNRDNGIDQREFSRSNRDNGIDQREFSRSNRDNGIDEEFQPVYSLVVGKIYTQMNSIFKDTDIITLLRKKQLRYSGTGETTSTNVTVTSPRTPTSHPTQIQPKDIVGVKAIESISKHSRRPRMSYKLSTGLFFGDVMKRIYRYVSIATNLTNCPSGDFHWWRLVGAADSISCVECGTKYAEVPEDPAKLTDRTEENFYFQMGKVAEIRCRGCKQIELPQKQTTDYGSVESMCVICKNLSGNPPPHENLDEINTHIRTIETNKAVAIVNEAIEDKTEAIEEEALNQKLVEKLATVSEKSNIIDKFVDFVEKLLGENTNIGTENIPMRVRSDIYVIDHLYNGTNIDKPIVLMEQDNKIIFKEKHNFFNTDVFYYADNRSTPVDVFYDALTLRLIGYKEKHRDFIKIDNSTNYLIINSSLRNKIIQIGHESKYINIKEIMDKYLEDARCTRSNCNDKSKPNPTQIYYRIIDNLINKYINTLRTIIDKVKTIIFTTKYFSSEEIATDSGGFVTPIVRQIQNMAAKYAALLKDFATGSDETAFADWNKIRDLFAYEPIDWTKTNVVYAGIPFVNSDTINYFCDAAKQMKYYLLDSLLEILESNPEKIRKINLVQFYIEIINYIYGLYNKDAINKNFNLTRFEYILNGTPFMVDMLRKYQGLVGKELEKERAESDEATFPDVSEEMLVEINEDDKDFKEAAESLDVEQTYYGDENEEDYAENVESEE